MSEAFFLVPSLYNPTSRGLPTTRRLLSSGSARTAELNMIPLRDDNPTTLKPVITIGLIVLCTLAFSGS